VLRQNKRVLFAATVKFACHLLVLKAIKFTKLDDRFY